MPDEAFANADADLEPGRMVGEYRVESKIGEGGFGSVYASVHPLIGKRAAVKVLNRQWSSNPQMVSRFIAEARAVNQIRHKGIIDIFSFGALDDGRQYYVMELLEGETLDAYLERRGALPPEEAIPILRQVARALDAAHSAGIAHRDLKPENVFLSFDDEGTPVPKLLDFGIAKLMGDGAMSGHRTRTGTPMGTPHYMSPEQCRGQNIDLRTDIYSFGIMVHLTLTGQLPFDGETLVDLLFKQTASPAPAMSSVLPGLATALDAPVLRMLEKSPDARPESRGAGLEALAQAASGAGYAGRVVALKPDGRRTGDLSASSRKTPGDTGALAEARTVLGATGASGTAGSVAGPDASALPTAATKGRATTLFVGVAAVAVGVLVTAAFGIGRPPRDVAAGPDAVPPRNANAQLPVVAPSAASTASAASPANSTPAVTPEPGGEVAITVAAEPPGTEIFLGAERLGAAPGPVRLKRDDKELTLTLKAAGFLPRDLPVLPSKDKELFAPPPAKAAALGKPAARSTGHGELENPFQ